MAARAEPGAPFPPSLPLRLRILGYSSRTSSGTKPAAEGTRVCRHPAEAASLVWAQNPTHFWNSKTFSMNKTVHAQQTVPVV